MKNNPREILDHARSRYVDAQNNSKLPYSHEPIYKSDGKQTLINIINPLSHRWFAIFLTSLLVQQFTSVVARAQDPVEYFQQNCKSCHTIGGGKLTGPDLKDVSKRRGQDWLIKFIENPKAVIESGDADAKAMLEEYRITMPRSPGINLDLSEKLVRLIEAESKLEESQFKGLQVSNAPFTEADRKLGRDLFMGNVSLANKGTACISCHNVHDMPGLGGGKLGEAPDLTNVFERYKGRKVLSAWLMAPPSKTMEPIYKDHKLKGEEIHALVAYFESTAGETTSDPSTQRVTFLLLGLAAAAVLVFAFDAIWKKRFQSVRQDLVDTTAAKGRK